MDSANSTVEDREDLIEEALIDQAMGGMQASDALVTIVGVMG